MDNSSINFYVLLQKQFYLSVLFLCLNGTEGWFGTQGSPLSCCCSWYALMGRHLYYAYLSPVATSSYLWHSSHAGTFPGPNLNPEKCRCIEVVKSVSIRLKDKQTSKRLVLYVNLFMFFCVVVHMDALTPSLWFVYLFVTHWADMTIRFIQVQSATASWASALFLHLPSTVLPHASLCCRGYCRAWCGFWLVRLCSTDGPVIPPSLLLLLSAFSVRLSCAAAPKPKYPELC